MVGTVDINYCAFLDLLRSLRSLDENVNFTMTDHKSDVEQTELLCADDEPNQIFGKFKQFR